MRSIRQQSDLSNLVVAQEDYARLCAMAGSHLLSDELDRAIVVPMEQMPQNVVTMNSRCVYFDESAKIRREVEVVYPEDADPAAGRISVLAPVGSALLGVAEGQSIDWVFPNGRVHRLRVERVERARDARSACQASS